MKKITGQEKFNLAADIAHAIAAAIPEAVRAAGADPHAAAYALWGFYTEILLEGGYTIDELACLLKECEPAEQAAD